MPYHTTNNPTDGNGVVWYYNSASPTTGPGAVVNMDVASNVAGIVTGNNIATGNVEFWGTNYAQNNAYNVPGANNNTFDFGDQATTGNYGSMQISNYGAGQTLLAINNWGGNGGSNIDIGIGNQPVNNPDWTFANNAGNYTLKNLIVLVGNPNTWTGASGADWGTAANWQAGATPGAGVGITLGAVPGGPSAASIDLGSSNRTINSLTFQNSVPSVTVASSGGNSLIFDNGSNSVPVSVSGTHFINSLVTLNSTAAITVASGSDSLTFNNSIGGTGGVTLGGAGTLNFTAANGYSGGTTVNGGRLNLIGAASLANVSGNGVTINSGGTFATAAATPAIDSIALNSGGTLLPAGNASNSTGVLNVGSLNIAASSTLGFKAASAGNYDQINVSSALTIGSDSINVNLYSPNGAGQFYGTGTFTLMNNAGSLYGSDPASAISVANPLSDLTYTFGTAGNSVTLTVGLAVTNPVWNGGSSSSNNWSDANNWANFVPGGILCFDGSTRLATNNDQAGQTYAGMLFYTSAGAFTHSGSAVTLTGPITNYSPNTQTLNLPVLFSSGGTINAAGGPIVTTALGTMDNGGGTLMVGGISSCTLSGAITGLGGLAVTGPGNVTLASSLNTYAGNTRIQAGTLIVGHPLALQNTVVDMNAADAGTLSFGSQTAATLGGLIGTRNLNLGNTNLSIGALGAAVTSPLYSGVLSGGGGITKVGNGNISLSGANTYGGGTFVTAGTLTLGGLSTSAKIMCVGDSITEGIANSAIGYGYRGALYNDLVAGGYTNVQMVGTHNTGPGTLPRAAMARWLGRLDHRPDREQHELLAYHPRHRLRKRQHRWYCREPAARLHHLDDRHQQRRHAARGRHQQPEHPHRPGGGDPRHHPCAGPSAETLLAEITPRAHSTTSSDWEYTYNQAIIALVAAEQAKGYNVVLADMNGYGTNNPFPYAAGTNSAWPQAGMGGDGLHPNDYGYSWMAQQWYNSLVGAGGGGAGNVLPATSTVTMSGSGFLNALSSETIGPLTGSSGTVNIGGGTLTINSVANSTYSGALQGPGGLFKSGTASLTLAGTATYTGPTTVNSGRLAVVPATSLASSSLTVQNSGTLSGNNAALPPIFALAGGHVAPGTPSVGGTFTPGSLSAATVSLAAGSFLDIKALNNGTANDRLLVSGSNGLTIANGAEVDLYGQDGASPFNPNGGLYTFDIMGYSGDLQGYGVYGLSVANKNPGTRYIFGTTTTPSDFITLTVGAFPQWNGGGANNNWTTAANWTGVAILPGDQLVFDGTTNLITNNNQPAGTTYNGMTFNPTAGAFTHNGNAIVLTGDILNNSPNTQTINLPMTLAGAGTRQFMAVAGPIVTGGSGTINNGGYPLAITGSANVTLGGSISGAGALSMNGAGTLALNAANTFSGNTRVNSGILSVGHSLALQGSTLDMNAADSGSVTFNNLPAATLGGLTGARNLALGVAAVTIGGNNASTTYSGVLSGGNGLTKTGSGMLTLSSANTYTAPRWSAAARCN